MLRNCRDYLDKVDAVQALAVSLVARHVATTENPPPVAVGEDKTQSPTHASQADSGNNGQAKEVKDCEPFRALNATTPSTSTLAQVSSTEAGHSRGKATLASATVTNLAKVDYFRHFLGEAISSLHKGINDQEKQGRSSFKRRWAQTDRWGTLPLAGWPSRGSRLTEVMDADWLWEEEIRQAWLDSGSHYRLDRLGRRVSKL